MNNFILTNRKVAKFYCSLPIGQIKWFIKESNIILGEIVVLLYFKSLPGKKIFFLTCYNVWNIHLRSLWNGATDETYFQIEDVWITGVLGKVYDKINFCLFSEPKNTWNYKQIFIFTFTFQFNFLPLIAGIFMKLTAVDINLPWAV